MLNVVLLIAYEGTCYLGWQKTDRDHLQPSIEFVLQSTLEKILQHPVDVQAASRTDRGVHAEGQVVNFITTKDDLDLERLMYALNCLLPDDIRVLSATCAPETDFHATMSATAKQYVYRIYTGPTLLPFYRHTHWHVALPLNLELMQRAAGIITGEHDFIAFRNHRKGKDYNDTVRRVTSIDISTGTKDVLEIKVTANNFLYKMCRNIVGTLVYVGLGKLTCGQVANLFQGAKRPQAGITAPARGLSLHKVFYTLTTSVIDRA